MFRTSWAAAVFLLGATVESASAAPPPDAATFDNYLKTCALGANIKLDADILGSLTSIYDAEKTQGLVSFTTTTEFLQLFPESQRLDAYKLYVACVDKFVAQYVAPPPSAVVTYKVCSGEYERACQAHDAYLYCYEDVKAWADARCTSSVVQRINTYGGNKCGYSIDSVVCTGPK